MKTNFRSIFPAALCATALLAGISAQAEQGKFYVEADAGGVVTTGTELKEFFGTPLAPNSELTFDPGFRLGIRGGYGVTDWFDAEVETGFMANNIKSATGATETDASLANFPFLINARFHCPAFHKVNPYFDGGLGGSTTILSGDDLVINGIGLDGSTAGITFAYQAFAGLRFAINARMGISVEYHYFATTDSTMQVDVVGVGITSDEVKLGGTSSHTATIAFDYRF
jgi:outer membrane protein W